MSVLLKFSQMAASSALPAILGVLVLPMILRELTLSEASLLTLAWAFLSVTSNFDLGVGRAIGRTVAADPLLALPITVDQVIAGLAAQALIGAIAAALLLIALPTEKVASAGSLVAIAMAMPFVFCVSGVRYALEGGQHFGASSAISLLSGASMFLVPLVVLFGYRHIEKIIAALFLVRAAIAVWAALLLASRLPGIRSATRPTLRAIGQTLLSSRRLALLSMAALAGTYFDKFAAPYFIPLDQLALYTVQFEVIYRAVVIPAIVVRVLAPMLVASSQQSAVEVRSAGKIGFRVMTAFALAVVLSLLFYPKVLVLWLHDSPVAEHPLLGILIAGGVALSGYSMLGYNQLIAQRRESEMLVVALGTTCIGVVLSLCALASRRIELLAAAWFGRVFIEVIAMHVIQSRLPAVKSA